MQEMRLVVWSKVIVGLEIVYEYIVYVCNIIYLITLYIYTLYCNVCIFKFIDFTKLSQGKCDLI